MRLIGLAVMRMISRSRPEAQQTETFTTALIRHAKIISDPSHSTAASVEMHHRDYWRQNLVHA
jgi:hypothetical protein